MQSTNQRAKLTPLQLLLQLLPAGLLLFARKIELSLTPKHTLLVPIYSPKNGTEIIAEGHAKAGE
jgi:hypothetical protein